MDKMTTCFFQDDEIMPQSSTTHDKRYQATFIGPTLFSPTRLTVEALDYNQ